MTFNILTAGSRAQASKVMENFRHANFGANLLPYNTTGSGVNNTLDIGSTSFAWRNIYANNFYISGVYDVANQPHITLYNGSVSFSSTYSPVTNMTVSKNVGSFTYSSGKVTPASAGTYQVNVNLFVPASDGSRAVIGRFGVYNSSNTLLSTHIFYVMGFSSTTASLLGVCAPTNTFKMDSGDYLRVEFAQQTGGGTGSVGDVSLTMTKIF